MAEDIEAKLIFAKLPLKDGSSPIIMLGLTQRARDDLSTEKTHTLDLTSIGVPLKMIIFGEKDHAAVMATIEKGARDMGVPLLDERRNEGFGLKP